MHMYRESLYMVHSRFPNKAFGLAKYFEYAVESALEQAVE